MATTNHFQTRVIIPSQKSSLTENEQRLEYLIHQAHLTQQKLNEINLNEDHLNQLRINQIEQWSNDMLKNIDQLYEHSFMDFKLSLEQLKIFQNLMLNLLKSNDENHLDGKKLSVIEQEICILKCLTYHLDVNKVKIDGKLKFQRNSPNNQYEIFIDDQFDQIKFNDDFIFRILIHRDSVEIIENLELFRQFGKITTNEINSTTPERVLTINGPRHLDVIEEILSKLSSSCELRILLHQSYAPIILGKLGDRAKILREKYSLHTLTIYPTCAPLSTERLLLIQSSSIEKIIACLHEIFTSIQQHTVEGEEILFYDEKNYDASLAHEYGGFVSSEMFNRQHHESNENDNDDDNNNNEDEGVKRYSAFDAWNGSVDADADQEFSLIKLGDDCIMKEFFINHGQFGALLGPHGVRIAQIRSQCRTVRIHTVAGSSIDTCSVKVIGPRADVNHAVNLIFQSIKEHDRKFPFKHHRFSGRLR